MEHRIAAKAFIVHDGKVLLLRRRPNDVHKPGEWDIPGGRLAQGENPYDGLKRETKEEAGLDIDIVAPLDVHHFTRDDGQGITMIIFACTPRHRNVKLSEEHVDYKWADANEVPEWLRGPAEKFLKYYKDRL